MELVLALAMTVLTGCGLYLLLRRRLFDAILGLTLLSYAVNLFIFGMGRLTVGQPPIVGTGGGEPADPLPQALVLTAIVIGFAMTGFLLALSARALGDGEDPAVPSDSPRGGHEGGPGR